MPVILGSASRPTFDAAGAMLQNKQIETQKAIAGAQIRAGNARAGMGMAQSALGMLNQNAQQARQLNEQRRSQANALLAQQAERMRQQQMAGMSFLDKRLFEMQQEWAQNKNKAALAGMGFKAEDQRQIDKIEQLMRNVDVNKNLNPAQKLEAKIRLMQEIQRFVPTERIPQPEDDFKIIDGIPHQLDRKTGNWVADEAALKTAKLQQDQRKQVGDEFNRLIANGLTWDAAAQIVKNIHGVDPRVNPDTGAVIPSPPKGTYGPSAKSEQKIAELALSRANDLVKVELEIRREAAADDKKLSESEVRRLAYERFAPIEDAYVQQGLPPLTPLKVLEARSWLKDNPGPYLNTYMNSEMAQKARDAQETIRQYEAKSAASVMQPVNQQQTTVPQSPGQQAPTEPHAEPDLVPLTFLGGPVTPLIAYSLGEGARANQDEFLRNPISRNYVANAIAKYGNNEFAKSEAYKEFDDARAAIVRLLPRVEGARFPADAKPGALFLNENYDLVRVPTGKVKVRGGGGSYDYVGKRAGSYDYVGEHAFQGAAPPVGQQQTTVPQSSGQIGRNAPQQDESPANRMTPPKSSPPDVGGVPPKTLLFLEKGSEAEKYYQDQIEPTLSPEEKSRMFVYAVDPNAPLSNTNRIDGAEKYGINMYPAMIRFENDGTGNLVKAAQETGVSAMENLSSFSKSGENAPPPGGVLHKTFVFLERGGPSEKNFRDNILPELSQYERSNIQVFRHAPLSDKDSLPTEEDGKALDASARAGIVLDEFPVVARGDWNGNEWQIMSQSNVIKGADALKSSKEFKDFIRPQSEIRESEAMKSDASAKTFLTKKFNDNMKETGNPLAGMSDPYRSTEGMDANQRRSQSNYRKTYEEWKEKHPGVEGRAISPEQARQEAKTQARIAEEVDFENWKKENPGEAENYKQIFTIRAENNIDPLKDLPDPHGKVEDYAKTPEEIRDFNAFSRIYKEWKKSHDDNLAALNEAQRALDKAGREIKEAMKKNDVEAFEKLQREQRGLAETSSKPWSNDDQISLDSYRRREERYKTEFQKEITKALDKALKANPNAKMSEEMIKAVDQKLRKGGISDPSSDPKYRQLIEREKKHWKEFDDLNKKVKQQKQHQSRMESDSFTNPIGGMSVAPAGRAQSMRTSALMQPVQLSAYKPYEGFDDIGQKWGKYISGLIRPPTLQSIYDDHKAVAQRDAYDAYRSNLLFNQALYDQIDRNRQADHARAAARHQQIFYNNTHQTSSRPEEPTPSWQELQAAAYQPGYNVGTPWSLPASMGWAGGTGGYSGSVGGYLDPIGLGSNSSGYSTYGYGADLPPIPSTPTGYGIGSSIFDLSNSVFDPFNAGLSWGPDY